MDKPFKMLQYSPNRNNYLYELYKLESLIDKLKQHLEAGGAPKIEIHLIVSKDDLRGKSFDVVIVDDALDQAERIRDDKKD